MITLWDRICCAIGMHAWWYERIEHPEIYGGRGLVFTRSRLVRSSVRVCAACPTKQELVEGRWVRA